MGTINSGTGLISGIDINGLVEQLMQIESRPRQLVERRNQVLESQKTALQEINAALVGLKSATSPLLRERTFEAANASSSNPDAVDASASDGATPGSFNVLVDRLTSTQQNVSRGFADRDTAALPESSITFESAAARLDSRTRLAELNGAEGVRRGLIRITDRQGNQADVDLSRAVDVDDVLGAINNAAGVNIEARVDDGALLIEDLNTGAPSNALTVTDARIGSGVAASLGLDETASGNTLIGRNIRTLGDGSQIASFFDGNGVRTKDGFNQHDLVVTDRNGATHNVNLTGVRSVEELKTVLEDSTGGAVSLVVASDGVSLELKDLTGGGGTFSVAPANGSLAASDLGFDQAVAGDTITGKRVVAGLNSKLLNNVNGGSGAVLGTIDFTDRSGATVSIDLSDAASVSDVINTINEQAEAAGVGVAAQLNNAGNGLLIRDTSGATASNLVIDGRRSRGIEHRGRRRRRFGRQR